MPLFVLVAEILVLVVLVFVLVSEVLLVVLRATVLESSLPKSESFRAILCHQALSTCQKNLNLFQDCFKEMWPS